MGQCLWQACPLLAPGCPEIFFTFPDLSHPYGRHFGVRRHSPPFLTCLASKEDIWTLESGRQILHKKQLLHLIASDSWHGWTEHSGSWGRGSQLPSQIRGGQFRQLISHLSLCSTANCKSPSVKRSGQFSSVKISQRFPNLKHKLTKQTKK